MQLQKIVIAPDSFKESMTAQQVGNTIKKAFTNIYGNTINYDIIPMADGGEGTTDALMHATGATKYTVIVNDPLMRPIKASYARADEQQIAIIEMAAASGLDLLKKEERNPLYTSSYGTGELIKDALDHGAKTIILGIGGSATNDGGTGMLSALGVQFTDANGKLLHMHGDNLAHIAQIDTTNLDTRLKEVTFKVACDVTNPLLGEHGATNIYGPQKGADMKMIPKLDFAMSHYHDKIKICTGKSVNQVPGSGAAGGMGAALLAFFDPTLTKGIDIVFDITNFHQRIKDAYLIITGEGRMDYQTIFGKTPVGVALAAKQHHIPVIAICGSLGENYQSVYDYGIDSVFSIISSPSSLENILQNSEQNLLNTATDIARILKLK
ncbi:glycerate kinase [Staphylococcus roterodami]|nr:glycerate kinase [Staphylococcus roterodami]